MDKISVRMEEKLDMKTNLAEYLYRYHNISL